MARKITVPEQFLPSPIKPGLQWQVNDPIVLLQIANSSWLQSCVPLSHSFTSRMHILKLQNLQLAMALLTVVILNGFSRFDTNKSNQPCLTVTCAVSRMSSKPSFARTRVGIPGFLARGTKQITLVKPWATRVGDCQKKACVFNSGFWWLVNVIMVVVETNEIVHLA